MLAEIGDISRFPSARKLASWARLTPTVRGSQNQPAQGPFPAFDHPPPLVGLKLVRPRRCGSGRSSLIPSDAAA